MIANLPPLYFIRHGETNWNKNALVQGSIDTDLNDTGVAQSISIARALAVKHDELLAYDFVVSPQRRAQHTMRIICEFEKRNFTTVRTDARLRELEFGIWEGKSIAEMHAMPNYPTDPVGHYLWQPEGGESYEQGLVRVDAFLSQLTKPTLIVAHGAVGRIIIGYTSGIPGPELTHLPTPQGCYCVLRDGTYQWFDGDNQKV